MKVTVQTEFLCSYYYHAAKNASDEIMNHKLPHSLYYSISALILWQCVFESFANFQIRRHKLETYQVTRRKGLPVALEYASIKEKWIYLPIARCKGQFVLNKSPFKDFAKLVDIRNDLIHFNDKSIKFEKDAPPGTQTVGQLNAWMKSGEFLSGSIFDHALRCALAGKLIVQDMFQEYSRLTGDALPDFLSGHEVVLQVKVTK